MAVRRGTYKALGDYLNDTFSFVPRLWREGLAVGTASALPGAILWILSFKALSPLFDQLSEDFGEGMEGAARLFALLGTPAILWTAAAILQYLGASYQKAFMCLRAGSELERGSPRFLDLARAAFGRPILKVIVQDMLTGAVAAFLAMTVGGLVSLPLLVLGIGRLVREGDPSSLSTFLPLIWAYVLFILAALAASWYLKVRTGVSAPAAILEGRNSIEGIGRSVHLTARGFWRIFGSIFVVELVISFGLGILTGPITFGFALPGFLSFFRSSAGGGEPSLAALASLYSSLGWAIGIGLLLSAIVQGTLWPVFLTILYADLRTRSGEIQGLSLGCPEPRGARRLRSFLYGGRGSGGRASRFGDARRVRGRGMPAAGRR